MNGMKTREEKDDGRDPNATVSPAQLIDFYTDVVRGMSAADRALIKAFADTTNLTPSQLRAYVEWLNLRDYHLQDVIELAMFKHIFEVDTRN